MDNSLASWNDTARRDSIVRFVEGVTREGEPTYVPPAERISVFDNDGTLWCEKPMPIELGFILARLAEMAEEEPALRDQQPWKAAREKDYAWLGDVITRHYRGDEDGVKVLLGAILKAFDGMSVDDYSASAAHFLHEGRHPTLGRGFRECGYLPMVELLRYLESHGFTNYIASGGDRDFMRPVTQEMYGIPSERVIGSSNALRYLPNDGAAAPSCIERRWTCSTTVRSSRCGSGAGSADGRSSGGGQFQRRRADAAVRGWGGRHGSRPPRSARRRRAGVQLHGGRGGVVGAGGRARVDGHQHQAGLERRLRRSDEVMEQPRSAERISG